MLSQYRCSVIKARGRVTLENNAKAFGAVQIEQRVETCLRGLSFLSPGERSLIRGLDVVCRWTRPGHRKAWNRQVPLGHGVSER